MMDTGDTVAMEGKPIDISVIVPCRNEERHIRNTISMILSQEGAGRLFSFELLIIDGQSTDNTVPLIEDAMRGSNRANIKLLINRGKTTPRAFNLGIKNAAGRYICLIGAHVEISETYLMDCLSVIKRMDADNVGGPWRARGDGYTGEAIALAFQSPFSAGGAKSHRVDYEGYVDSVWGGFYRREVFDKIGMFDEELIRNQDDELNYRLTKGNGKIWQSPGIKYFYICRNSLKSLFLQYFQYGYWKVRVIQKHKIPASIRHLVPGTFVGVLLSLSVLSFFSHISRLLLLSLILIYMGAVFTASALTCRKQENLKFLPLMPLIFSAFHFGYGLGFLKGLLDFSILRKHRNKRIEDIPLTR